MIQYPAPLTTGSKIALTAFSSGVDPSMHQRLDLVINSFKEKGFQILEGQYLRQNNKGVSASKEARAKELMSFLLDDDIDAIAPPWGGELAMEILPLLDFDQIRRAKPKWIFGYSDVSTISCAITSKAGWATAHTTNFMEQIASQPDPLTSQTLNCLATPTGMQFCQHSSEKYQKQFLDFHQHPRANFNLTEQTRWKILNGENADSQQQTIQFSGRLIGGCLDTLVHLFDTPYLDLEALKQRYTDTGIILYLENAEATQFVLQRRLLSMRFRNVFKNLKGIMFGRSYTPPDPDIELSYKEALLAGIGEVDYPILYDVDIGHQPPNLTLINGALAEVEFLNGDATVTQWLL
ncbi:LD-carboxypeptidase [Paraneptunicella aestuarii]|uniref:S66 family peptidase n=1 Tax=Paraneptunicella aestuarii TaxID=2831148 RepID=UPI001E363CD2|nr:S66 peptidase family protein [Paraneptunicella aestuarii]UAA39210.1 LD-carboxypeptidase [Paraneptunicella aestuarii]